MIMKVTIFKNPNTIETSVEFYQVVNAIKRGKHQNTAFAPSGVITVSGNRKNLLIYTGLVLLSFDGILNDELDTLFKKICEILTTYCCFKNHSGNGINVLVKTDCLDGHHKTAYKQVVEVYENYLGLKVSNNNPDKFILCHLSYDQNIYYNEKSNIFQIDFKTRNIIITEVQSIDSYKDVFDDAVEYTKKIVFFEGDKKNEFIYTLAKNCYNDGIPMVKALELIMSYYGHSLIIKGIVKRAYKKLRQFNNNYPNIAFSVYLKNLRNYKENIPLEKRVMFEFFILTYVLFEGKLNFSEDQFRQELGVYYARIKIINEFITSGFLYKEKISVFKGNKKVPKNSFTINPDMVPKLAELYMIDSSDFLKHVMPLLRTIQKKLRGYGLADEME